MALFENFPYTNLQNLNLDWLIREIKNLEQGQVLSVNGQTGNVILYKDASVQLPSIEESTSWAFWRNINNTASGIQFTSTGIEWVNGSNRIRLLTVNDIPSTEGVLSVNGKAGVVVLIGSDINVSETDQRTIADALADIANNYSTLTATVGTHTTAITALQTASSQHGSDISALQTASSQHDTDITNLTSTVDTLSGYIAGLQSDIAAKKLRRVYSQHSNVVIGSSGYTLIDSYSSLNIDIATNACVSMNIRGWSGTTHPITLAKGSNGTDFYIVSEPQTISQIQIEYYFAPAALWN